MWLAAMAIRDGPRMIIDLLQARKSWKESTDALLSSLNSVMDHNNMFCECGVRNRVEPPHFMLSIQLDGKYCINQIDPPA